MKALEPVCLGAAEVWPPFTIPSGVITVNPDTIRRVAREVPIGLITTKSVGLRPYGGYAAPVFSQYSEDSLSTAIGLSTPGLEAWLAEVRELYPLDGKFLLLSIFGEKLGDFVELARALAPYCDGLELNFCCPHSLQYGEAVARQGDLTAEITGAVRALTDKPVVVKLSPNVRDIGGWAKALVAAGADAVAAIGPTTAVTVVDEHSGEPVLSFGSGGLSGPAILERGIECVSAIRAAVDVPIIAGGGISGAEDVAAYRRAGGNIFSVGTSLAGMDTATLRRFFELLLEEVATGGTQAKEMAFSDWRLKHRPYRVGSVERRGDLAVLRFDRELAAEPGQFVFAWLPGVGEKPYSVAGDDPLLLGVRKVGKVSEALYNLEPGDEVMVRGPFGKAFPLLEDAVLVAGGCGAVPLRFLAERLERPLVVLGAAREEELLFREDFERRCETVLATDDGSAGLQGTAVDALAGAIRERGLKGAAFYNCGPEPMMAAAASLERECTSPDRIMICVERHTCCGVGLCGKCSMDGYRTCVDGPCFRLSELGPDTAFGSYRRGPSGAREPLPGSECG